MNSHDERAIAPVVAHENNASSVLNSSSTIKIDSLCIKLGFVKEKSDAGNCRHFSIRGYVSGMRERGSSKFLPFAEKLPPMDIPQFRYWLCQSCLRNCGNVNISHETPLISVCDQSKIRPCVRSFRRQDCRGVSVLPFGEGTSGLKPVDNTDDDVDESILPALGVNDSQPSQGIPANNAVSQEPITFCSSDTNVASEANAGTLSRKENNDRRDDEDPQQDRVVKETITGLVGPPIQSSQQNDLPNGNTRRKARKVRLLKELLCGNNEIQQRKKETSAIGLDPKPSSPLPASSSIKRKVPHNHDQDQDQMEGTTPANTCKKAKTFKGNAVAKTTMVEHSKDPGVSEDGQNNNKYPWKSHGTHRSSIVGKVNSDPVTAWRSIFSTDNHVTTASGACKPTYDISKDRGTGPHLNLMGPPHPEKKYNFSMKMSKNPLKSIYMEEGPRYANVGGGSRLKDGQSETELGLNLFLKYDPQSQLRAIPSTLNHPPSQDHSRTGDLFMGGSSIPHRIPSNLKSKEESVHGVINRHAARPMHLQDQRPYTYGSCSGHQKMDFSDPQKRNTGVRGYSAVNRLHSHQRQERMVSMGRSDEREIVELMAKNQYERNLCEARGSNNNFIPRSSGFHNINMHEGMVASSHQDYFHMIGPSMNEKSNIGPTTIRNPSSRFFHQDQGSDFDMFHGFQQSRNQPSSGIWISDSEPQRHHNSRYHHVMKSNKKITDTHLYAPTNLQVLEAFNKYDNDGHHNETYVFSNFPTSMPHRYTKYSDKDKQKSIVDLDLNVAAPSCAEEQNNFESLNMTSSKAYHPKHIHSLDSSYPNEAIPAMQLLSLMDAGKSNHSLNKDERKFSKPLSPCYTHGSSNMTGKTKSMPIYQFPHSSYFQSSSLGAGTSYSCGFQTGKNVKLTSGQVYEEKSRGMSSASTSTSVRYGCGPEESYGFPVPWHVSKERSEHVTLGPRIVPNETEICTINKNPADFSSPGPENVYMINAEDLVIRGEKRRSETKNANGPKRQKKIINLKTGFVTFTVSRAE